MLSGSPIGEVSARHGTSRQTLHSWRRQFEQEGMPGAAERHPSGGSLLQLDHQRVLNLPHLGCQAETGLAVRHTGATAAATLTARGQDLFDACRFPSYWRHSSRLTWPRPSTVGFCTAILQCRKIPSLVRRARFPRTSLKRGDRARRPSSCTSSGVPSRPGGSGPPCA
ncbi:hypothetical protein [Streptomyces sp. NPDC059753]|uniref:hypothetical protein n=1 Tax=Streptomyces sp. NPDC059753 TaxID=3346933 RepID=UPI00365FB7C0